MPRKPPATAEEVIAAVASLSEREGGTLGTAHSVRFYSALTIAGLVAQQRGCGHSWPDKDTIAKYVSLSSVRRMLQDLVATGKLYAVDGNHWAVHVRAGNATYYIDDTMKRRLIQLHEEREERARFARREQWVSGELHKRYRRIVEELTDQWDREHPKPNWEERW